MHIHHTCTHELAYCAECKVVHCSKCHKEWGEGVPPLVWPQPVWPTMPAPWAGWPIYTWATSETTAPTPGTLTVWS